MASQPTADQIRQVCEFTFVGEKDAVVLLKKNQGDAQRAVEAYYNDPVNSVREDYSSTQWDPSMDNVPYADDTSTGAMPSMSRPNSRVDNHKPQAVEDLSMAHAQATANVNNNDPEDEQMKQAIAMSLGQGVPPPPQENGVTGTGQQFGPANREHYDASQWAMTAPVSSYRELIDHPPPTKRRRLDGEPAFLRGSTETGYLGSLLTIYHAIPLAREALLLPPMKVMSYGHDPQWWSGQSDENRKSLTLEVDQYADRSKINFLAEVQCLMAFLDDTKRAYGSVDALADLQGLKTFHGETRFSQLMEAWRGAAMSQCGSEPLSQVFTSTAAKADGPEIMTKDMVCLEPPVSRGLSQTLVALLDDTIVWNDSAGTIDDVWFQHCGEILTVRMHDPEYRPEGLKIATPTVWYSDRYLEERKMQSREIRNQLQAVRKEISQYANLQKRLEFVSSPGRKLIRVKEVLGAVSQAAMAAAADRYTDRPVSDVDENDTGLLGPEIQAILERVDRKLLKLEDAKSELSTKLQQVRMQLTCPTNDPDSPVHKYLLMGVSTRPEITYVRRKSTDLLGLEAENGAGPPEWQWWRICWVAGTQASPPSAPFVGPVTQDQAEAQKSKANVDGDGWADSDVPYTIVQVDEELVLEKIRIEWNSVVLVYANEHAVEWKPTPLSDALRQFIARDNNEFANELKEELEPASDLTPQDSDAVFEDVALEDSPNGSRLAHQMAPISISGSHRDEDGQPSPKRPKSSDEQWNSAQDEKPPSYEEASKPEMQERKQHKIGMYAEQMLEKYGHGDKSEDEKPEALHLEHPMDLPR